MIGSRAARTLDFDKHQEAGTWSCRHYFAAHGTLRHTLGFGTTDRKKMFDIYDRIARRFEIVPEEG